MSTHRTAWHFFFVILLRKRGPRWLEVREEVPLSEEPLRLDYLFLRKPEEARLEDVGQSLRGLWARLSKYTIAELKTLGRPYGSRGLDRLWSYMHLFFANPENSVDSAADLSGVLIVPSRTPTLHEDVTASGLAWLDLGSATGSSKAAGSGSTWRRSTRWPSGRTTICYACSVTEKSARWRLDGSGPNRSARRRP